MASTTESKTIEPFLSAFSAFIKKRGVAREPGEPREGGSPEKPCVAGEPRVWAHVGQERGGARWAKCRNRRIAHVRRRRWGPRERVSEESNRRERHEAYDHVRHMSDASDRRGLTCEESEKGWRRTSRCDASLTWRTSLFWWLRGPDVSNFRPLVRHVSRLVSEHATYDCTRRVGVPPCPVPPRRGCATSAWSLYTYNIYVSPWHASHTS